MIKIWFSGLIDIREHEIDLQKLPTSGDKESTWGFFNVYNWLVVLRLTARQEWSRFIFSSVSSLRRSQRKWKNSSTNSEYVFRCNRTMLPFNVLSSTFLTNGFYNWSGRFTTRHGLWYSWFIQIWYSPRSLTVSNTVPKREVELVR